MSISILGIRMIHSFYQNSPQKYVDLFIQNVESQHTKCIVLLYTSGRSIFVECTFSYAWEYFNHGIRTVFLIHVRESQHIRAISHETAAQKFVNEKDVDHLKVIREGLVDWRSKKLLFFTYHIEQVEHFTEEIAE